MVVRHLQFKFARHLMGFLYTNLRSLVQALFDIEDGLSQGLWPDSSSHDSKEKNLASGKK